MRLIGHLDSESAARQFSDYLIAEKIANRLEQQKPDGWAIWVEEEDQVAEASSRLTAYRTNPSAPEFQNRGNVAQELREKQKNEDAAYRKRVLGRRDLFRPLTAYGFGPLSFVLIAASVLVFLLSNFGMESQRIMPLFITNFSEDGYAVKWFKGLSEIRQGEVWRLITPIFIHFNILHILFNMLWLRDLGSMVEGRQNSLYLALLVLVLAVSSNLGQYYFVSPNFGGMSGVVYGLLGYVWLRGKLDPASGLFLHQSTVIMMIIWFVACWTGLLGAIANIAHTVGLLVGMAWGYLASLRRL